MSDHVTVCRCGEKIVHRPHHKTGKLAPITADVYNGGNIEVNDDGSYRVIPKTELYTGDRRLNHFANCPLASSFMPKRASGAMR